MSDLFTLHWPEKVTWQHLTLKGQGSEILFLEGELETFGEEH